MRILIMKLAIMQPYFLPYLGYWQMLNAVDRFILYDDVNYIKNGWINRNNLLDNGKAHLFTLMLDGASSFNLINQTHINGSPEARNKVASYIKNSYRKAPFFKTVFPMIEEIINYPETNIALLLENHFRVIADYLQIKTEIVVSSHIEKDCSLKAQDKVLDICKRQGAEVYINAIGGTELYSREDFAAQGIKLQFIKMLPVEYPQFKNEFVPNLSILDIMMFNDVEKINGYLKNYELQ